MKRYFSFLLAVLMCLSVTMAVYAAPATPSDADRYDWTDMPIRDNEVPNNIMNFSAVPMAAPNIYIQSDVVDANGKFVTTVRGTYKYSTETVAYYQFPDRPDGTFYRNVYYYLPKSALPSPGTYGVVWKINQGNQGLTWQNAYMNVSAYQNGVKTERAGVAASVSGKYDIVCTANVQIGYKTNVVTLIVNCENTRRLDIVVPLSEPYAFTFSKQTGGAVVSPEISAGNSSPADVQIEQGQQMIEQQDNIIQQVINTTQTISSQLSAFWNQLAGEFTNLFTKMNQQHDEKINADRENTEDIIDSQDANTDKIVNKLEDTKKGIIAGIIDGLKGLFIPSDEFFKAYFDDLFNWFSDRLGFLSFPIELFIQFVDLFLNASEVDCVLTLPSFSISGHQLWPDMPFNFTEFLNLHFAFILTAIRMVTSVYIVICFVQLCNRKWEEVMRN